MKTSARKEGLISMIQRLIDLITGRRATRRQGLLAERAMMLKEIGGAKKTIGTGEGTLHRAEVWGLQLSSTKEADIIQDIRQAKLILSQLTVRLYQVNTELGCPTRDEHQLTELD